MRSPQQQHALSQDAAAFLAEGLSLRAQGRAGEAYSAFAKALSADPACAEAHVQQGLLLDEAGRYPAALDAFAKAMAVGGRRADVLVYAGNAHQGEGRANEALTFYDEALRLEALPEAHNNRAHALLALGRADEALSAAEAALALRPAFAGAEVNRGNALLALDRAEGAINAYDAALALDPALAGALKNKGAALHALGRFAEAEQAFDQALARENDPGTLWNKALLLLQQGRYGEGFAAYEARRRMADWHDWRLPGKEWDGVIRGKTHVVLYAEQGLGDTIQFARYAQHLARKGARVTLQVQPALVGLMRSLEGVEVMAWGKALSAAPDHLPLMSVPCRCGLDQEPLAKLVPYLSAKPKRIEEWRARIPQDGFHIGIGWQGNPSSRIDRGRSVPLAAFAPLAALPGVRLVSLQRHDGLDQLAAAGFAVEVLEGLDAGPDAFLDTAAVMMNLDLVVTSDTALAHLVGALGRPAFVTLKHMPDWRWGFEGEDSPFYPRLRLFRQKTPGDWAGVFARVAAAVKEML